MNAQHRLLQELASGPKKRVDIDMPKTSCLRAASQLSSDGYIVKKDNTFCLTPDGIRLAMEKNISIDWNNVGFDDDDVKELAHELADKSMAHIRSQNSNLYYFITLFIICICAAALTYTIMKLLHYF